jgi:hypothetical protein
MTPPWRKMTELATPPRTEEEEKLEPDRSVIISRLGNSVRPPVYPAFCARYCGDVPCTSARGVDLGGSSRSMSSSFFALRGARHSWQTGVGMSRSGGDPPGAGNVSCFRSPCKSGATRWNRVAGGHSFPESAGGGKAGARPRSAARSPGCAASGRTESVSRKKTYAAPGP